MERLWLLALVLGVSAQQQSTRSFTEKHIAEVVAPWHESDAQQTMQRQFLAPLLHARVPGTAEHTAAGDFIASTMRNIGWTVTEDAFEADTPRGRRPFRNIVATKNPQASRRIVLAAHYDSKVFDDFVFIGATDSAAPCAILLHLATVLNERLDNQKRFRDITLELFFFDGEEAMREWTATDSLYGARHLAELLEAQPSRQRGTKGEGKTALGDIDLLVLLDLLGAPNPHIHNFFTATTTSYARLQRIETRLRTRNLLRSSSQRGASFFPSKGQQVVPDEHRVDDDHRPFLQRGVPVLHLIPLPFPPVWHRPEDDASAIDMPTVMDWGQILAVFIAETLDLA